MPDLVISYMKIELETSGHCNFGSTQLGVRLWINNVGNIASGPFIVDVNGSQRLVPAGLAPHQEISLWFAGYVTNGGNRVVVDAAFQVEESNEDNNMKTELLPIPTLPPTCTPVSTSTQAPTETGTPTPTPSVTGTATATPSTTKTAKPTVTTTTTTSAPLGIFNDFESASTWKRGNQPNGTFERSQAAAHKGNYAGKLDYHFPSSGNDFVVFLWSRSLAGTANQITAWVKGDGSGHYLNTWVKDSAGETWQFTFGRVSHTGWQKMTAYLDPGQPWPAGHIDGPNNGALDYPISFRGLVLDDAPDSYSGSGTIYVDELASAQGTNPTPTLPPGSPPIDFHADRTTLNGSECTTLHWNVDNVREVYFEGAGTSGHGSRQVCPSATTVYTLHVLLNDGTPVDRTVTIMVSSGSQPPASACQPIAGESYGTLLVNPPPTDRPAQAHADLNLALRSYKSTNANKGLVDYNGQTDPHAPQLPGLFSNNRTGTFSAVYRVYDWNWGCNCRGTPIASPDVTLAGLAVTPGEVIHVPDSGRTIGSGFQVLVLYASTERITLQYTPHDTVVNGYTLHVENICVDPNLLSLYESQNNTGRSHLPALRAGQAFGRAKSHELGVAIRSHGTFLDPRSRKDWWKGR